MSYSQTPLFLRRRHPAMPTVYKVDNHPLVEGKKHVRNVYVGYMGTDKKSVKDSFDFEKAQKCPEGGVLEWDNQGLLRLEPGDYYFLRDPAESEEAKDDVLAVMVTGRMHHDADVLNAHEQATQAMLGVEEERTVSSTAFERTGCARKIRKKRCYSVGVAVQLSRRVVAPTASLAQDRPQIKEYRQMVEDLLDSTSDLLLNVQDALPTACLEAFAANADLTGQPEVRRRKVYGTSSIQINISAAGLSALDNRLASQLGDFGCEHYDSRDSPDHLTTMFSNPDIPAYYTSGAFHLLQLGVYTTLDKYVGVTFSGQRRHVGTAPTPPPGFPPVESAYRLNVVCYPKDAAVDGLSRFTLASLPGKKPRLSTQSKAGNRKKVRASGSGKGKGKGKVSARVTSKGKAKPKTDGKGKGKGVYESEDDLSGGAGYETESEDDSDDDTDYLDGGQTAKGVRNGMKRTPKDGVDRVVDPEPLYITPEMINMRDEGPVTPTTNRATFARSGNVIMDRSSHVTFMARALHQLNTYVWRQVPAEYAVTIDTRKMFESISYAEKNGARVQLSPWLSAPNVHSVSSERSQNKKVWAAYQVQVRKFIPRIAFRAFTYDEEEGLKGSGADPDVDEDLSEQDDEHEDGDMEKEIAGKGDEGEDGSGVGERPGADEVGAGARGLCTSQEVMDHANSQRRYKEWIEKAPPRNPAAVEDVGEAQERSTTPVPYCIVPFPVGGPAGSSLPEAGSSKLDSTGAVARTIVCNAKRPLPSEVPVDPLESNKRRKVDSEIQQPASSDSADPTVFIFLSNLTAEVLQGEAEAIHKDFALAFSLSLVRERHSFSLRDLLDAYYCTLNEPTSHLAPGRIREIQVQLRAHAVSSALSALMTRWERYSVLLSSVHVWYWLDVVIKREVDSILKLEPSETSPAQSSDWLRVLVSLTQSALVSKKDPIILNPHCNLSLLSLSSGMITVSNLHKRTFLKNNAQDQELLASAVVSTVQQVLMDCLEFPSEVSTNIKERRRAWLMGTLVEVLGHEFLATRYAWDAWSKFSVKDFLGDSAKAYGKNPDLIQPFKDALLVHPVCQVGSDAWKAYNSFKGFLMDQTQYTADGMQRNLPSDSSSNSRVGTGCGSVEMLDTTSQSRFDGLDIYLKGCLEYATGRIYSDSPLHQFLQEQPDFRIPFREKAPSRIRFQSPGSPYHESTIRTNAGIFSAVIYRGITYNSLFSNHPESPMVFEDVKDWEKKIAVFQTQHPSTVGVKNFFCKPDAYGQSIRGRRSENAARFWDDVQNLNWPEVAQKVMKFDDCFELFLKGGFPTMGNLCCYLLACDLHYAGVCEAPTLATVASFIRRQRGGSYHVLPALGFGSVDVHPTDEVVVAALSAVEAQLRATFSQEERRLMGVELEDSSCHWIGVEHILCKYKRALKAKRAS